MTACEGGLVERRDEVRLLFLAALAGEHALLIGPPGTAKSELARRLRFAFAGSRFFERLLTRFSVPEELFGPLSIKRLEADEYHRLTEGYLPTATIAFLDEIFKANSAILNALLTLLNERLFDNGKDRTEVPLVSVVGASNELPEGVELDALFDRFLIRCLIEPVSNEGFDALLTAEERWAPPEKSDRLQPSELEALRVRAAEVAVPTRVRAFLRALRVELSTDGKPRVSDRRWRKLVGLLRVAVAADGRSEVTLADCGLARWCLWSTPEESAAMGEILAKAIDAIHVDEVARVEEVASALVDKVDEEAAAEEQACDDAGRLVWRDSDGNETVARRNEQASSSTGDPLYIPPSDMKKFGRRVGFTFSELWERHYSEIADGYRRLEKWTSNPAHHLLTEATLEPVMRRRRFSREHVASRERQLEAIHADVSVFLSMMEPGDDSDSLWPRLPFGDLGTALTDARAKLEETARATEAALEKVRSLEVHES